MMMPYQDDARYERRSTTPPHPRSVWDSVTGREWRVWAADCRGVPGARSSTCLIFDCGTTVRRVWSPPQDWATLSDVALLGLADPQRDR
jgi:hypothetical protein